MLVPATHTVPSQQPPLQLRPPAQEAPHWWLVVSQACPDGQSAALLQPQLPPRQALPAALLLQSPHTSPERPQALVAVPGAHTPPLQQDPWHGWLPLQVVTHWCVVGSQALPLGQSPAPLQPQPLAPHTTPRLLVLQSTQAPPLTPHWVGAVPPVHVPPLQQPPLHGSSSLQWVPHLCVLPSHERPLGQSAELLQLSSAAERSAPASGGSCWRPGDESQADASSATVRRHALQLAFVIDFAGCPAENLPRRGRNR
jgi:hypothetical protein